MDQKKIIEKIQNGLKACSQSHIISAKDVQMIIKGNGTVDLMNAQHIVVPSINILKVFKVSAMEDLLIGGLSKYLKKKLSTIAEKHNIGDQANARIFTKQSDFFPCVYLQDGEKIISEITINELLK